MPGQACGLWQEGFRKCTIKHENWPLSSNGNRDSCKSLLGYVQQLIATSSVSKPYLTLSSSINNSTSSKTTSYPQNCFSTSVSISSWLVGHELEFGFILGLMAFASLKITATAISHWAMHAIFSLRRIFGSLKDQTPLLLHSSRPGSIV